MGKEYKTIADNAQIFIGQALEDPHAFLMQLNIREFDKAALSPRLLVIFSREGNQNFTSIRYLDDLGRQIHARQPQLGVIVTGDPNIERFLQATIQGFLKICRDKQNNLPKEQEEKNSDFITFAEDIRGFAAKLQSAGKHAVSVEGNGSECVVKNEVVEIWRDGPDAVRMEIAVRPHVKESPLEFIRIECQREPDGTMSQSYAKVFVPGQGEREQTKFLSRLSERDKQAHEMLLSMGLNFVRACQDGELGKSLQEQQREEGPFMDIARLLELRTKYPQEVPDSTDFSARERQRFNESGSKYLN